AELRRHADRIIDTSDLTVHELRELLIRQFRGEDAPHGVSRSLVTLGYKFDVQYAIDFLFDVRFLRKPFFVPDLKPLTGEDPRGRSYVLEDPDATGFFGRFARILLFLI